MTNPFLDESRRGLARLLGCLNRNELSPSYGSFDRNYWHYRTITAFESATFCQGVLPLALAYAHDIFGAGFHRSPMLLAWIDAALLRWTKLQHDDGSFDEWYPFERSHVATAFTTFAASEAMLLVQGDLLPGTRARVIEGLTKSARWLSTHLDDQVLNHTAGAVPAIHNVMTLTGDASLQAGLDRNIALLAEKQSPEGWFLENGGFDAGYLSLSIDYLERYFEHSGDERARAMSRRGLEFLRHIVHPDGSSGGTYAARNTKYLMPRGIMLAAKAGNRDAIDILHRYMMTLESGRAVTPSMADDRYTIFFFLPNVMQAALAFDRVRDRIAAATPAAFRGALHFPESGLVVRGTENVWLAMNVRKAGTFALFRRDGGAWHLVDNDGGYFIRDWLGRVASSQYLADSADRLDVALDASGSGAVAIEYALRGVSYALPLETYQIPFLAWSNTVGRVPFMNALLEKIVKNVFIRKPARSRFRLERRIAFNNNRVTIRDRIAGSDPNPVELRLGGPATAPHVPSSRYFVPNDLAGEPLARDATLPIGIETVIDLESGTLRRNFLDPPPAP